MKVIYIPGIGDHRPYGQDKIIRLWRIIGLKAYYCPVGWGSGTIFKPKVERILKKIDELTKNGDKVALVGVSAGAGAALNVYVARKAQVSALVFIAGKIYGTANINPRYFQRNPAFRESIMMSDASLKNLTDADKAKMLYIYSPLDRTVIPTENRLKGVLEKTVPAFGHISAIYIAILFYGRTIAKFIKSKT